MQILAEFAELVEARQASVHIDITPLLDTHWTGIPIVAAQLARQFLETIPDNTEFFFEDQRVSTQAVADALARNSGIYLHRDLFTGWGNPGALDLFRRPGPTIGFFPSLKRVRRYFDLEFSVVHDLSTLITPQFHTPENIRHHMDTLAEDLASDTATFCVSQATLDDLRAYMGVPAERLSLMYNGVSWPEEYSARFESEVDPARVEPYYVVLGTREPRKNAQKIFDTLAMFPELLDESRFIFVGKIGWMAEQMSMPESLRRAAILGRIHFTGYVSEYEKYKLLRAARASIYPSLFEGFGLPVVESMSVGTPCLCSFSSSMPEVGGEAGLYFDPLSVLDIYDALKRFAALEPEERRGVSERSKAVASRFDWRSSFAVVAGRIAAALAATDPRSGSEARPRPAARRKPPARVRERAEPEATPLPVASLPPERPASGAPAAETTAEAPIAEPPAPEPQTTEPQAAEPPIAEPPAAEPRTAEPETPELPPAPAAVQAEAETTQRPVAPEATPERSAETGPTARLTGRIAERIAAQ